MVNRGLLSGGAAVMKRYQASVTMATAGIPVLGAIAAATDKGSITPMGQTTQVNTGSMVGLLMDPTGTVAATGMTNDEDLYSRVIVNPDLIYGARACAGTTAGTALALGTTTAASAGGTQATGVTSIAEGAIFCATGANAGLVRRCTDTSGSVSINFPRGIAIGDTFVAIHGFPCLVALTNFVSYDLTLDLTEIVAQTSVLDQDDFATLDIRFDLQQPTLKTEYQLISNNHLFGSSSLS